jgi:hypothetical protein
MALSILDGNQSATTLSTIVTSGQHITAHTVVSLGTQAVADITTAISGTSVCVGNLGLLQSTVATEGVTASGSFIKIGGHTGTSTTGNIAHVSAIGALRVDGSSFTQPVSIASVTIGNTVTIAGTVTANPTGTQTIAGTVTANVPNIQVCTQGNSAQTSAIQTALGVINENNNSQVLAVFGGEAVEGEGASAFVQVRNQISGTVTIGSAIPTGTNRIGVVTIGGGTVTVGAGTAQIGSVTASISNSVVTFYPAQGTTVTNTNFTSITPSTTLVSAVAGREVLTVFNEGAGNLHISPGATCTTISYQVRLSTGDYWECPAGQTSLLHTAVFATAGTARVTEVS